MQPPVLVGVRKSDGGVKSVGRHEEAVLTCSELLKDRLLMSMRHVLCCF